MAEVRIGGRTYQVEVRGDIVVVDGHEFPVQIKDDGDYLTVRAGDAPYRIQLPPEEDRVSGMAVAVDYRPFTFEFSGSIVAGAAAPAPAARKAAPRPAAGVKARPAAKGAIVAQIAGRVTKLLVAAGASVKAGDVLLLLEAMKMENEIKAPADGTVKEVPVAEGQRVTEGETLVVIE